MNKRLVVIGVALLFVLVGCGGGPDEQELTEAENLVTGLATLGMMTDVDAYSSFATTFSPPPFWEGPDTFDVPTEWNNSIYYRWVFKFAIDSAGVAIDSGYLYLMFVPDIWDTAHTYDTVTALDIGILAENRNIWFHTYITVDTIHVTGNMRWNWEDTWYNYAYDMSVVPGDTSGTIDITTSANIRLSAHFEFDYRGAGSEEDNWGKFDQTIFVRFCFFEGPDANGYDGYYTLLSENWKVKHYFKLEAGEA